LWFGLLCVPIGIFGRIMTIYLRSNLTGRLDRTLQNREVVNMIVKLDPEKEDLILGGLGDGSPPFVNETLLAPGRGPITISAKLIRALHTE